MKPTTPTKQTDVERVVKTLASRVGLATAEACKADMPFSGLSVAKESARARKTCDAAIEEATQAINKLITDASETNFIKGRISGLRSSQRYEKSILSQDYKINDEISKLKAKLKSLTNSKGSKAKP